MNVNKKIIFYIFNLMFFVVIACLVYIRGYSKFENSYNDKYSVYERFCGIEKQVNNFEVVKINMEVLEKEVSMVELFGRYSSIFYSNDMIENSYKSRVVDLLKENSIKAKIGDLKREQGKNVGSSLSISFIAEYDMFCEILFKLEQFSEVKNISYNYKGEVYIESSPLLSSSKINDVFSGRTLIEKMDDFSKAEYFKKILDKIQGIKNIGQEDTWRDIGHKLETPFLPYHIRQQGKTKIIPKAPPKIIIAGIMHERDKPMVIIEDKFYYIGDMYKNAKIVKINQNSIVVNYYGGTFTIRMEN